MKKTIKSLIVAIALSSVASGSNLTLTQIDTLYQNAVSEQVNDRSNSISKLLTGYEDAVKGYRGKLLTGRNPESVATIAAIDKEIANIKSVGSWGLLPLVKGADVYMKTIRNTYNSELESIIDKSDQSIKVLNNTLSEQLINLKNHLVKSGDMETALKVHEKLTNLGVVFEEEPTDKDDHIKKKSMVLTKKFGGYASAISKQKLRLEEGAEYTLTFFTNMGDRVLNEHDCLPLFHSPEGKEKFKGGDRNEMRVAQRASESRKVRKSLDGWDKVTVKFTHTYNVPVVFGVLFYDSDKIQISLRDFTLTDSEGKNFINKNLNSVSGWQKEEHVSFNK